MASENKGKGALLKTIPGMTQKLSRGITSVYLNREHLMEVNHQQLYTRRKSLPYPLHRKWERLHCGSRHSGEEKSIRLRRELCPDSPVAHSVAESLYWQSYPAGHTKVITRNLTKGELESPLCIRRLQRELEQLGVRSVGSASQPAKHSLAETIGGSAVELLDEITYSHCRNLLWFMSSNVI
jgi:hypothetical protein